jgi:hypothetical protein
MSSKKAARIDSSLIARKGQASPAHIIASDAQTENGDAAGEQPRKPDQVQPLGPTKSLTVKLDAERYKALRQLGVDEDRTHQDIMVAALDAYLASKKREMP